MIYTDRSRYTRGLKHCPRSRYLAYHYKGIGLRPKAESIPLATGTSLHGPVTKALMHMRDFDKVPSRGDFASWVSEEAEAYKKKVESRGFDEGTSQDAAYVAAEQSQLIQGMCWVAFRELLPFLQKEFKILDVEREETFVVGCTCGLGDGIGEPQDHENRPGTYADGVPSVVAATGLDGCQGVVMMSRPDFLAERRSDGQVGNHDLKTNAYAPDFKGEDHLLQIAFGTLGAERRLGRPVTHYYIHSLLKGKRDFASKADRQDGGIKKQQSVLCYAYWRGGDPPFDEEEYRFEYTREKGFSKIPLWMQTPSAGMTVAEWWVMEKLPATVVEELIHVSTPFQRPDRLVKQLLQEIVAEEREWAWKCSEVQGPEDPKINELIRRSWDCTSFYGRDCEFMAVCKQEPGWQKPEESIRMIARVPNHLLEKEGFDVEEARRMGFSVEEEEGEGWGE